MKKYFLIKGGIRLESDICICNIRRSLNVYVKIIALRNSSYLTVPSSCLKLSITPSSEEDRVLPKQVRICIRSPPQHHYLSGRDGGVNFYKLKPYLYCFLFIPSFKIHQEPSIYDNVWNCWVESVILYYRYKVHI